MYISQETPEQTKNRLLKVIAEADFKVFEDFYAFEEFSTADLSRRIRADALALVRDDEMWSQLAPSQDKSKELFFIFSFHFVEDSDNSGFVGWLATTLKEKFGTGIFVICGQNDSRGGIFDYWGCPYKLAGAIRIAVENLIIEGKTK
jgi:hypothetical protein